jgi:hypothetical protein
MAGVPAQAAIMPLPRDGGPGILCAWHAVMNTG